MRRGYSLTELIAVLAVVGILAGVAAPKVVRLRDAMAVSHAAQQIAAAHRRARFTAVFTGRAVELTIQPEVIVLRPLGVTTPLWQEAGPAADRVALTAPSRAAVYSPVGLGMGVSNGTYVVSRGSARRVVVVSRLGRVRMKP